MHSARSMLVMPLIRVSRPDSAARKITRSTLDSDGGGERSYSDRDSDGEDVPMMLRNWAIFLLMSGATWCSFSHGGDEFQILASVLLITRLPISNLSG